MFSWLKRFRLPHFRSARHAEAQGQLGILGPTERMARQESVATRTSSTRARPVPYVWRSIALCAIVGLAGTAMASYLVASDVSEGLSGGVSGFQRPSGVAQKGIGVTPFPCECPPEGECIEKPYMTFWSPTDGSTVPFGQEIVVEAHICYANDYQPTITVECPGLNFTTQALSFLITPPAAGQCELIGRAYPGGPPIRALDKATTGLPPGTLTARVTFEVDGSPTVALASPLDGATYIAGNTVSLSATASDPDGQIDRVEFEVRATQGGHVVFSHVDQTAPYGINMPNAAIGAYIVTARAFDNEGQGASDSRGFTVVAANIPPTVAIAAPTASSFPAPATITFEAAASDADGTIDRVEFELRNTASNAAVLSGSDSLPPYTITATGLQVGTYTMTVRAIDDSGGATVAAKSFEVTPAPLVQMVFFEPQGAPHLANGTIQLRARATVQSGSISQVQFWRALGTGHQQIGTGTAVGADSWEFNWVGVPEGTYRVWAQGVPTLGEPAWSGFRDIDVVTNTAPDRVTADQLPSPEPNMNGVGTYGQLYDTYRQNIYTVGQQIALRARFSDSQRNLQHIDFYLHAADQQVPRLLRRVTFPVPAAQSNYLADTMVTIDAAMVSHRMQHIYAMAVDSEGLTATSLKAPVAIRQSYSQTFACVLSGGQCARTSQPHRAVPGLIPAVHYDFALGSNGNRGVAGESYFDASALTSTFPIAGNGREDDGSIECPVGSAWNGPGETNCYLKNRRKGTFSSYLVEFTQAGVYELKLCFRNAGIGRAAGGAPAEDLGLGVRLSFEGVDALGQISTIEAFGNIEVDSNSQRVSESSVAHNVTLPDCPSDLRTLRILGGSGNPLNWPQGFRSRMSLFARAHGTNPYDFDLQWMALLPVPDANNVGIRISQPAMGDVVGFAAGGMQPTVVLRSAVTKNPFRPGGTITYRVVNPMIPAPAGSWQVVPGGAGIPADAPDNSVVLSLSDFAPAPNMQRRWEVNATLNWEGVNYESPTSSFYVTNGERHEVQWLSPTVNQTVSPGQVLSQSTQV